ncbi:reverse transcriptase [Tanacetum coccineum]
MHRSIVFGYGSYSGRVSVDSTSLVTRKACSNAFATQENLSRRGVNCSSICPICFAEIETVEHMFFECHWTKAAWFGSALSLHLDNMSGHIISRVEDLLDMVPCASERMNLHTSLANIAWQIWKSRNECVFNDIPSRTLSSFSCIGRDLSSLCPSSFPTSYVSVVSESQESSLRWIPPLREA